MGPHKIQNSVKFLIFASMGNIVPNNLKFDGMSDYIGLSVATGYIRSAAVNFGKFGNTIARYRRIACTMNFIGSTSRPGIFKLAVTVHQCLNGRAPPYLSDYCIMVSGADTRQHRRSASRHVLAVPRFRINTYSRLAFSVARHTRGLELPSGIYSGPNDQCRQFQAFT